jgi:hypothetical protein
MYPSSSGVNLTGDTGGGGWWTYGGGQISLGLMAKHGRNTPTDQALRSFPGGSPHATAASTAELPLWGVTRVSVWQASGVAIRGQRIQCPIH